MHHPHRAKASPFQRHLETSLLDLGLVRAVQGQGFVSDVLPTCSHSGAVLCFEGVLFAAHVWINKSAFLKGHRKVFGVWQTAHTDRGSILTGSKLRTPGNIHQDCLMFHPILKSSVCKPCSTGLWKDNFHILTEGLHVLHGILFPKDDRQSL